MSTLTARKGGAGSKPNAVTASINAADAKATTVAQARDANSQLPSPTLLLPLTVTTLVLAVYSATVYPSVTGGDSGELLITTCNLGIAHPPGYPTYTMVGWAWLQLTDLFFPKAQKAYRINLLCATFGAIAAGFISWTAATLAARTAIGRYTSASPQSSANRWSSYLVGFFSGVGFALMPTVWLYSIQGEVFALNNLLCSILTALTVRYYRAEVTVERQQERLQRTAATKKEGEGKSVDVSEIFSSAAAASAETSAAASSASFVNPRTLVSLAYLGAFVCGLCLTNQHTTVFPVFVTAAFITWSLFSHGLLSPMRVVLLILSVVVGFSPYAFILIRSHWNVMDSWGDQRTLSGFLVHLLRQEYGTFQLAASELSTDPGMWSRLKVYGENMNSEMLRVTPILAVLGLVSSLFSSSRSTRRSSLCLFLSFLLYLLVFHKLANLDLRPLFLGVQARFWQQANMYVWIWAGAGVKTVADGVEWIGGRKAATTSGRASSSVQVADSSSSSSSSKASQAKLLLTSLYTVAFIALHFTLHYPIHDHRANDGFYTQGVSMLRSFPKGSIVLLNGDLNNNLVKYPQQCEGVRPDLSLLSLQLMSWDWFVPVQRDNYPAVIFPGIRYHTTTPQSFNIKRFLDANIKSKKSPGGIFLCGPFKDGDNSNIRTRDPNTGATTSKFYEEHPYGLCSQLLPHGAQPKNMTTHLRRGWVGLPRMSSLPPYLAWKYGEETWEHVMYKDNMQRLAYLTSIASFNSNKNMEDVSLLKVAYDFTEEMRRNEALLREFKLMGEYEYRSAGVIYGLWSKHLYSLGKKDEAETAARRIYYSWRQYLLLHPGDPEILPAVENKLNPYSGTPIVGLEGEEEYLRLPELKTKAAPQQQQQPQPAKKQTDAKKQQDPASAKPQPQPKKQQPKKDQPGKK